MANLTPTIKNCAQCNMEYNPVTNESFCDRHCAEFFLREETDQEIMKKVKAQSYPQEESKKKKRRRKK